MNTLSRALHDICLCHDILEGSTVLYLGERNFVYNTSMLTIYRMRLSELISLIAKRCVILTTAGAVAWILHEVPTPEVDQFDLQSCRVHEHVFQLDVTMENTTIAAKVSSINYLPHDVLCYLLAEDTSAAFQKLSHIHAWHRALHDNEVVVWVILPVQHFNYIWTVGFPIDDDCQLNL